MNSTIKVRLSVMMFLQYFIAGAFTPILSLYFKDSLRFSGTQVGMILSVNAAGSIIAPIIATFVADRSIKAERLLGVLQLAGGALLLLFKIAKGFYPIMFLFLGYTLINAPTFALTNAIIFHHSPGARHKFGSLRVWGTIGWIAVAWVFSYLWLHSGGPALSASRLPDAFNLAALTSFGLGLYAFTLPASRPKTRSEGAFLPRASLSVFLKPPIVKLCMFMLAMTFFARFYYFGTAPFLRSIGFADSAIMPTMSLGQVLEVFAMAILGASLLRYGPKKIILLGLALDIFRYLTAALGGPTWLVITGLAMHGFAYTFVFATASIYLDHFCDAHSRSGVHQIFGMITSGIGNFAGSLFCGFIMDASAARTASVNYHFFWLAPALGLFIVLLILLLYRNKGEIKANP